LNKCYGDIIDRRIFLPAVLIAALPEFNLIIDLNNKYRSYINFIQDTFVTIHLCYLDIYSKN